VTACIIQRPYELKFTNIQKHSKRLSVQNIFLNVVLIKLIL